MFILVFLAISIIGAIVSPIVIRLSGSWAYWSGYVALLDFIKIVIVSKFYFFVSKEQRKGLEVLAFIFLMSIAMQIANHIDWAILRTDILAKTIFILDIDSNSVNYDGYKLTIQFLNLLSVFVLIIEAIKTFSRKVHGIYNVNPSCVHFSARVENL